MPDSERNAAVAAAIARQRRDPKQVAREVKGLFRERGTTTEDLAEKAGVSRTTFSCVINGKRISRKNLTSCLAVMTHQEMDKLGHLTLWRDIHPAAAATPS